MQSYEGQDKFSLDRKIQLDRHLPPDASRRDQVASEAPQVVPSTWEEVEKTPTAVPGTILTLPSHSPEVNSTYSTAPFSPIHPRDAEATTVGYESPSPISYGGVSAIDHHAKVGRDSTSSHPGTPSGSKPPPPSQICGLRRRMFWILLAAVLLIIVAAAVGGGVGGALASHDDDGDDDAASVHSPRPSMTPPPSSTSSSSSSPSSSPTPSGSGPQKPPMDFTLQIWEGRNYTGESQMFYKPGGYSLAFLGRSFAWTLNTYDTDKERVCSVALCRDSKEIGWRGSTSDRFPGDPDEPNHGYDTIAIGCGDVFADPGCPVPVATSTLATVPTIDPPKTKRAAAAPTA